MTKKRITDLLKEAVNEGVNSPQYSTAPTTTASSTASVKEISHSPAQDIFADQPTATHINSTLSISTSTLTPATPPPKRKSSPTKAELVVLVTELQAELQAACATERSLQTQVARLKTDLQTHQQDAEGLTIAHLKIDQLEAALTEAKATILQLADNHETEKKASQTQIQALQAELKQERLSVQSLQQNLKQMEQVNTELTQTQKTLTQVSQLHKPPKRQSISASQATAPSTTLAQSKPQKSLSANRKFKRLRPASIHRKQATNDTLSNQEIGWFD